LYGLPPGLLSLRVALVLENLAVNSRSQTQALKNNCRNPRSLYAVEVNAKGMPT